MRVIRAYHSTADFETVRALTQAYDVEPVKTRILKK